MYEKAAVSAESSPDVRRVGRQPERQIAAAVGVFFADERIPVEAALRMQRYLAEQPDLSARIGIHSGPVGAGVVGSRKYAYDIWGETVNLAARFEAAGEPGKVNISAATCRLLTNGYACLLRGKLPVKNLGEMEMYFVEEGGGGFSRQANS